MPIQLLLLNRRHTMWSFTWICFFGQSTLQKTQGTLHFLEITLIFIFLRLLLPWSCLLVYWSSVGAWYLTTTPTISSFVPLFSTVLALPHELPLWGTQLHWNISTSIWLHRYKNWLFLGGGAYDAPTVANVDPSSSAACITALRSRGF